MRSLNKSLPRARRRRPTPQPDTHQAFRSAALTVTKLYKNAMADIERSRVDGYQTALEDLVDFLDQENIGISSGDGWRIRQWAMGRLVPASDSDEDDDGGRARSSSPMMERNSSPEETRVTEPAVNRHDSAPPVAAEHSNDADMTPPHTMFHFASSQAFTPSNATENASYHAPAAARRIHPAPRRSSHRAAPRNMNVVPLGNGAGQKRKIMHDYFNIDPSNERRDGPGGNDKRGRMS
jgi:hypothetical protein